MNHATVVITEKPRTFACMAPLLSEHLGTPLYAITTYYLGLYEFRYPRGLSLTDYPITIDPQWKERQVPSPSVWYSQDGSVTEPCPIEAVDLLKNASTIIFACDPDHSGAVAFDVLLQNALGDGHWREPRPAMHMTVINEAGIRSTLKKTGSTSDDWFTRLRNAGQAKKFFDYNFNANALALFGEAMRKAGCPDTQATISKYGLQLLYSLRDQPASDSADLLVRMANWQGTGRYAPTRLGSVVSMTGILDDLKARNLMQSDRNQVSLSETGRRFLTLLHPDCRDPDLPARLHAWMASWPDSKPAMARYLRTFFGKQKRFA
ncbi:MAG: hypothetical protein AWU57_296 [Marinobacter sp. T13-3]|nr:MAG: hypothetical protein AWU57_296 [Marinobacter sp. T13-3]